MPAAHAPAASARRPRGGLLATLAGSLAALWPARPASPLPAVQADPRARPARRQG